MPLSHSTPVRVRYAETDTMGFAHHSQYAIWLEMARIEWLDSLGVSYREMEKMGYLLPVLSMQIQFRKPCFFDDRLTILTRLEDFPRIKLTLQYTIKREATLISEATTSHAFMNPEGKPVRPPEFFLQTLSHSFLG